MHNDDAHLCSLPDILRTFRALTASELHATQYHSRPHDVPARRMAWFGRQAVLAGNVKP